MEEEYLGGGGKKEKSGFCVTLFHCEDRGHGDASQRRRRTKTSDSELKQRFNVETCQEGKQTHQDSRIWGFWTRKRAKLQHLKPFLVQILQKYDRLLGFNAPVIGTFCSFLVEDALRETLQLKLTSDQGLNSLFWVSWWFSQLQFITNEVYIVRN